MCIFIWLITNIFTFWLKVISVDLRWIFFEVYFVLGFSAYTTDFEIIAGSSWIDGKNRWDFRTWFFWTVQDFDMMYWYKNIDTFA